MKQALKAVDTLLQNVEKQFGKGAMMRLGDRKAERVPCIPTGSPSLDEALGCGGYPKGRVVEVYGPESSG
jgi:recombination protein RecA